MEFLWEFEAGKRRKLLKPTKCANSQNQAIHSQCPVSVFKVVLLEPASKIWYSPLDSSYTCLQASEKPKTGFCRHQKMENNINWFSYIFVQTGELDGDIKCSQFDMYVKFCESDIKIKLSLHIFKNSVLSQFQINQINQINREKTVPPSRF